MILTSFFWLKLGQKLVLYTIFAYISTPEPNTSNLLLKYTNNKASRGLTVSRFTIWNSIVHPLEVVTLKA